MQDHDSPNHRCNFGQWPTIWNRRKFLQTTGAGFATLAMQYLLGAMGCWPPPDVWRRSNWPGSNPVPSHLNPLAARKPHFAPKAKAVIFLFCYGGPSQVDLFDPKPALIKWHGKPIPVFEKDAAFFSDTKNTAFKSPYKFAKYRPGGHRHFGEVSGAGEMRRRFVRDPLDAFRIEQSCPGAVSDEHRLPVAGAAELRLVGNVRPGGRNRSAAGLRGDVGSSRRANRRRAELEFRLFAAGLSRHAVPHPPAIRLSI